MTFNRVVEKYDIEKGVFYYLHMRDFITKDMPLPTNINVTQMGKDLGEGAGFGDNRGHVGKILR